MLREHSSCAITGAKQKGLITLDFAYIVPRKIDRDQLKAACVEEKLEFDEVTGYLDSLRNG